jgi:HSP20 family protein
MSLPMWRGRRQPAGYRDPFSGFPGFDDLFDRMNQLMSRAFPEVARISIDSWSPPVDIQETDDEFLVEADVPGVRPEDVTVDLQGRELRIGGEYGAEASTEGQSGEQEQSRQPWRRSGRFNYRLTLPAEVNADTCEANLEHGVLRLRLPKATAGGRQRIPVRGGSPAGSESGQPGETPGHA